VTPQQGSGLLRDGNRAATKTCCAMAIAPLQKLVARWQSRRYKSLLRDGLIIWRFGLFAK